jgi:hypothetical protein
MATTAQPRAYTGRLPGRGRGAGLQRRCEAEVRVDGVGKHRGELVEKRLDDLAALVLG